MQVSPVNLTDAFQLTFGILFQEYHLGNKSKLPEARPPFNVLRMVWVVMSMILVMSYVGNLKSSLVSRSYDRPTQTISEIVEKDLTFHAQEALYFFLKTPYGQQTMMNRRLLRQAEKKGSIIPTMYFIQCIRY